MQAAKGGSEQLVSGLDTLSQSNNKIISSINMMDAMLDDKLKLPEDREEAINQLKTINISTNDGLKELDNKVKNFDSTTIVNSFKSIENNVSEAEKVYKNTISQIENSSAYNSLNDTQKD